MQGGGFGRKGITPGEAAPIRQARPAQRMAMQDDPYAKMRADFLSSERRREDSFQSTPHQNYQSEYRPAPNTSTPFQQSKPAKSLFVAYVLWFLFSNFSAHRIYIGGFQTAWKQVACLFVSVVLMIFGKPIMYLGFCLLVVWLFWLIADLFLIPGLCRKANAEQIPARGIFD